MKPTPLSLSLALGLLAGAPLHLQADDNGPCTHSYVLLDLSAALPAGFGSEVRSISETGFTAGNWLDPALTNSAGRWNRQGTLLDLGVSGVDSRAYATNNLGVTVGVSSVDAGSHAFLWIGTTATDLGTFGGGQSIALAINNKGEVAGQASEVNDASSTAYIWKRGVKRRLGMPAGFINSNAYGLNNEGEACGTVFDEFGFTFRAVRWDKKGRASLISTLGGSGNEGLAINDEGTVAGGSIDADGFYQPYVARGHTAVALPTLGQGGAASAINNQGHIVGYVQDPDSGQSHAALWVRGQLIDLSTVPALQTAGLAAGSVATGINNQGDICGMTYDNNIFQNRAWVLKRSHGGHNGHEDDD